LALGLAVIGAQAQAPADQPSPSSIHGHVADPSGARIPGTLVTVTNAMGVPVKSVTADGTGDYSISGLAPGSYIVEASHTGFALYTSSTFTLEAGQNKLSDVAMTLPIAQQQVNVTSDGDYNVSTEADANTSAIVIKGKDLDALSDDPDELSNELQALAGPAAGPNGGQIYIDGFTGGQLPPKSAIRQIVINQNPFSAQFERLGYGRIEILTKPGTDKLHGRVFGNGNDGGINAGNPFVQSLPGYYSYMLNGSVSGPLSKWASYYFSVQRRVNQNVHVYTIANGPVLDPDTNLYSPSAGSVAGSVFSPGTHMEVSPRIDMQLGQKNTLTLRYQYFHMNSSNNISGNTTLPTQASSSNETENSIQADDTQIINDHLVNETRAEYRLGVSSATPVSTAPMFTATGIFVGGGAGSQFSNDRSVHLEFQNFTTLSAGRHAIKFGAWMRDDREADSGNNGFNGSFVFPSINAFIDTWNGTQQGETIQQIAQNCPPTQQGGCVPVKLSYTTGPTAYSANVYSSALFYQDDWKVNPFLTLSLGLRWESQNHIPDHSDWAPRFAFAYALDGHKKGSVQKTVLRGGYGFFYDRFQVDSLMTLEQNNGGPNSQVHTVISDPTCFTTSDNLSSIPDIATTCGAGSQPPTPQINALNSRYHSPYTEMLGMSLERQLTKSATLTFTYVHAFGLHQMTMINSNAYLPGDYIPSSTPGDPPTILASRPDPNLGIVDEYFPEAVYKENQIIVNMSARVSQNFNLSGFYNASWAKGNTDTAENSYNLRDSYGRSSFVHPQWVFLMASYNGPWGLSFNPFVVAEGGQPFNFSTPYDLTGDNFFNSRPAYASSSECDSGDKRYVSTSYGCFDIAPAPGEALVPYNAGNSPASVAVNMRVSRTFGIGPEVESSGGPSRGGGGFEGGGGHGRGGGGGFRGNIFGMRGGGRGGPGTGRKYSLSFSAQALNVFNQINYGRPLSTVTASNFGKSTGLIGNNFAPRRFFFQTSFQF